MPRLEQYVDEKGSSPFEKWFDGLPAQAAAKVTTAVTRLGEGNNSNVRGVGEGVLERTIDYGPGYRVYFGRDGDVLILLLGGGTKRGQQSDISTAKDSWRAYKLRKRQQKQGLCEIWL